VPAGATNGILPVPCCKPRCHGSKGRTKCGTKPWNCHLQVRLDPSAVAMRAPLTRPLSLVQTI